MSSSNCLVVIVTHNSERHIDWVLEGLENSNSRIEIKIVDSGSIETTYLSKLKSKHPISVVLQKNIGFVAANNLAIQQAFGFEWILFLNPDARIEGNSLDRLIAAGHLHEKVGIFSLPLVRYDINKRKSLAVYDSLGISCNPIGRWQDIGSGAPVIKNPPPQKIEAICGALMLARVSALNACRNTENSIGFEPKLLMYKEDIELSLRLKRNGYSLFIDYSDFAYHCRGWNTDRSKTPKWAKWLSARNDLYLASKYKIRALPFALSKLAWVALIERSRKDSLGNFLKNKTAQ